MNAVSSSGEIAALQGITDSDQPEIHIEARNRFSQILRSIQGDLHPYIHYEVQQRSRGEDIPEDQAILNLEDLETILYHPSVERKEIRRIIALIRRRARAAQLRTEVAFQRRREKQSRGTSRTS
jgi:hypothetical protein